MFEPANLATTLARHDANPSIHLAIPALQHYNLSKKILQCEDVMRSIVFKGLLEEQALYTLFSSFCQPKSTLLPLSVRGVCRNFAEYVDADPTIWASVSGTQHSPNSPHPELIRLWIKRAGTLPLSFHIAPRRYSNGREEELEDEKTQEILEIFLRHAERWKNIAFELDGQMARTYVSHLTNDLKPKPKQLEHLELSATRLSGMDVAFDLFNSVELSAGTVTKFFWGCPMGFRPGGTIALPRVTVLGLDVDLLGDALACMSKLRMPVLEELKICFTGNRGFEHWADHTRRLSRALRKLARMPSKLYIQDDEMDAEDVKTLIRLAKENEIMTLGLLTPEPEMVTTQCEGLVGRNATFLARLWNPLSIKECGVMGEEVVISL